MFVACLLPLLGQTFGNLFAGSGYLWLTPAQIEAHEPGQEWREYGASGEPFFPQQIPYRTIETRDTGMYGYEAPYTGPGSVILPAGYSALTGVLGEGYDWTVGTGRATPVVDLPNGAPPPAPAQEGALPAALDYLSDVPGEIGEAGGEFLVNLFGPPLGTLAAVPGSLFENIPTWVPLLGAAWLLFGGKK